MLPDLWRLAHRRIRARRGVLPPHVAERMDRPTRELQLGVAHHLDADRWFHGCAGFVDGERATAQAFRDARLKAPKLGMFAHMSWEMCLDGALLARGELSAQLAQLSADFELVGETAQRALADAHGASRLAAAERQRFDAGMVRIRDGLSEGRWLSGYLSGAGICAVLMRMRSGFGFEPLSSAEQTQLALVLDARLRHAPGVLEGLLAERAVMQSATPREG